MAATCPECDNLLDLDPEELEEGETVTCDECGLEMEVISVEPLQLTPIDQEGYDDEDHEPFGRLEDEEDA